MMADREEIAMLHPARDQRRGRRNGAEGPYQNVRDALTGQLLDPELVRQGTEADMTFLRLWTVYTYADWEEARMNTGKPPISTKWVRTNKGDDLTPNIICRWLAREFRDDADVIFAATTPYEAIRMIVSLAAAKEERNRRQGRSGSQRVQISLVDIKRAYLNAVVDADRPVYVQLPDEDPMSGSGKCGKLQRHLYGTRGAAAGWEDSYVKCVLDNGFVRGIVSGCLFTHPNRDLQCAVYDDDFTSTGSHIDLDWFEGKLEAAYAITKRGRLGGAETDLKEATLLNRVIRWVDNVGI